MASLVQNKMVQAASGYVVAVVLIAVIGVLLVSEGGDSSGTSVGDRVFLTSGGTVQLSGHGAWIGRLDSQIPVEMSLPLTTAAAVAEGWTDPVFCSAGRGRYFKNGPAGEGEPFFLMYNGDNQLIGMYQFSKSEMPTPWKRLDELRGGGSQVLIDFEHWGLFLYNRDPTRACGSGLAPAPASGAGTSRR